MAKKSNPSEHERNDPVQVADQWCICRIPGKLRNVNEAAYTPQLLSIGPFHHRNPKLRDMESHKEQYYKNFCKRCSSKTEADLESFIRDLEPNILGFYAGATELDMNFVKVILVDACFIIELLLRNSESGLEGKKDYYILRSPLLRKAVEQDLLLFENQLPYFLLQKLYDFAKPTYSSSKPSEEQAREQVHDEKHCLPCFEHLVPCSRRTPSNDHCIEIDKGQPADDHPFLKLTCDFFKEYRGEKSVAVGVEVKHFTDLVRHFLRPKDETLEFKEIVDSSSKSTYDVRKLKAAGVKFRPIEGTERFEIRKGKGHKCNFNLACFRNMDLELTKFRARYEVECIIRNVMALEQIMYTKEAYVCSYFLLLDQLVDTVEDVNVLIENGVIINCLCSSKAVAKLINSLCQHIMDGRSCYADIAEQLSHHYKISKWNRNIAILKRVYFKDLWTGSSTILGIFVLVFSIIGSIKSLM